MKQTFLRGISAAVVIFCILALCSCSAGSPEILSVFADTSLSAPLSEIVPNYQAVAPDVQILLTYAPSGELSRLIREGADCDVFLCAAPESMDELLPSTSAGFLWETTQPGFLLEDSRIDLLETLMVLVPPIGNPSGITDFRQAARMLEHGEITMAVGGADGAAGIYTRRIFDSVGLNTSAAAPYLSVGTFGGEEAVRTSEGCVNCGIMLATDAQKWKLVAVDEATEDMSGRVVYQGAVLSGSPDPAAAQAFLDYLREEAAAVFFRKAGFVHLASVPAAPGYTQEDAWAAAGLPVPDSGQEQTEYIPEWETPDNPEAYE